MSNSIKTKSYDCETCCGVDIGSILDNNDRTLHIQKMFTSQTEAQKAIDAILSIVKQVESEPCQVEHTLNNENNTYTLDMVLRFSCQAELVIFQLKSRML